MATPRFGRWAADGRGGLDPDAGCGFNHDTGGERRAQTETHIADLADDAVALADHADALVFAEPHLPEPDCQFRLGVQVPDSGSHACANLVERTDGRLRTRMILSMLPTPA